MHDARELLESAAKAAGYGVVRENDDGNALLLYGIQDAWNPLTEDRDYSRLEAALQMHVTWGVESVYVGSFPKIYTQERYSDHGGDKQAARRMAGVRTAAAIGKAMSNDQK